MPNLFLGFPVSRAKFAEFAEGVISTKQTILCSVFESMDFWTKSYGGGGSYDFLEAYIRLLSGPTAGGWAQVKKAPSAPPYPISWDLKRTLRFYASIIHSDDANSLVYMGCGEIFDNDYGFGIRAQNNKVVGISANGGAPSTIDLVTGLAPPWSEGRLYEATLYPGEKIEFKVNGVLIGNITTNIPTGGASAHVIFKGYTKTSVGAGHNILTSGFVTYIQAET